MLTMRGMLCGSAASLWAFTMAQAADLPVKAKAVEYMKVCSLYGAGFYYIPGTDTCMRIGGVMRLDTAINGTPFDIPFWQGTAAGANAYNRNYFGDRQRLNLFMDTRTATDYGVVRTYANLQFDFQAARDNIAGGYLAVDWAFIQFAGFTFGKAVSQFDPQWTLNRGIISSGFLAGSYDATGIPQLAYTATFGGGFSATLSLEDAQPYRSAGVINTSAGWLGPFGGPTVGYGTTANTFLGNVQTGDHVPDIVANVRLDQAWGSLHAGAAAHEVHGTYYTATDSSSGHPDSTWGFAATAAFELKQLPTGAGDSFKAEATFANGAAKYVFGGTFDVIGGGRFAKIGSGAMAMGYVLDGVYGGLSSATGTGIAKSNAWDVSAYYEHYWNPAWRTSVFGSYSYISYGSTGDALMTAASNKGLLLAAAGVPTGSFNGTNTGSWALGVAQLGTKTAWTPVQNLTLSAEFIYTRINQNLNGTYTAAAGIPSVAAGTTFQMKDQNLYNGALQIARSF